MIITINAKAGSGLMRRITHLLHNNWKRFSLDKRLISGVSPRVVLHGPRGGQHIG